LSYLGSTHPAVHPLLVSPRVSPDHDNPFNVPSCHSVELVGFEANA